MTWKVSAISLVLCLGACVASPQADSDFRTVPLEVVSICTITANPDRFIGKIAAIQARYGVVKFQTSFLSDDACDGKSIISLGSESAGDRSVAEFQRFGDQLCVQRGTSSLCTLEADVLMDVRIRIDANGVLVADPIRVVEFTYLPGSLD